MSEAAITLESLGFTQDELRERVVESVVDRLMQRVYFDEDGEPAYGQSGLKQELEKAVKARIDAAVNALADKHILPNVTAYLENMCLQQTNQWGEAKGEKLTFVEYLVKRAEYYMQEQVDSSGKSKAENDSYGWNGKQTRITHLIHQHLHYSIETAMKDALNVALGSVAKGIHETCRLKLNEIAATLRVGVATK
jgi:hypothetical protein